MKRYTYDFIKQQFEKEGCVLLSKEYINSRQKMYYVCSKGHEHSICWGDWQQGRRCAYCSGWFRKDIGFIKSEFEKEGYILLTKKYINCKQKINYICPNGHQHNIRWNDWQQGCRCLYCYGNIKLTVEFIKGQFKKERYKLLTKEYKGTHKKLKCICPNGHKYETIWSNWISGVRCSTCWNIKNYGSGNPNWKGGISCEPYCDVWLDKYFKESIKERDNHQCQNPDCWGTSETLCVHHIDYNKKNCSPNNLIVLCNSCNSRANKNRKWHTSWYRAIMTRRYKYKY